MSKNEFMEVTNIEEIGEGMRVCLDFVDVLGPMDGLYIGNTGHGYIKVLAENRASEGYPARPFRINVGAFHQYMYQDGSTKYLHELNAGDEVMVTDEERERSIALGRVKMEKRPFVRVECTDGERVISATFQKSTSVYVVEEKEGECPILELKPGQRILVLPDEPGRHLGEKIDEIIVEK
ncbi:3-dehydroquinate synthase II [Salimicrobium halophilum]|uniref:3-dehydroquinate synthase II n=1 Tax=Salimicrobium halophilum TaxID=86666 RepID=A0A1G8UFZ5_9BACI|nr:3-dehydroquinate synthase II [Salimicrobium halophilum]SDJ52692.1 3-dehydroquinate synthase II [Salimicrobium halophilum]